MSLIDLFPALTGETGVALGIGAAAFSTLVALRRAIMPYDPMVARLRAHARRREQLRSEMLAPTRGMRRQRQVSRLRALLAKLQLLRGTEARQASDFLAQAGWRSRDALVVFVGIRMMLPILFGAGALAALYTFGGSNLSLLAILLVTIAAIAGGGLAPTMVLRRLIQRRYRNIQKGLPDALDLLVICAEAGLALDAALSRVAGELGPSAPELADELGLTAIELGFLPNRRQAFANLTRRVELPTVRGVVNTLVQTERYGTPLAHSLRVLAAEFRDQRMMRAEEKAARLPAILTVPMIIFIMPALFIVLIGPAIIKVMKTFG